ncbi:MAG: DUF305 domain-containing protein [Pseudonocardiales bacterium]|nr:DUF305 domain-containing protein [Pseudonocardiales bacterium]
MNQDGKPSRCLGAWIGQSVATWARCYRGLLTLVVVGGLVLVGCGAPSTSSQGTLSTPTLSGVALDKVFVDGMVPHHQAALDMARAELSKGRDLRVKALAQNIAESQTREIGQMRAIARRIGAAPPAREWSAPMGTLMGVPISMNMPQMGSMVASAAHPDQAFLLLMIPHHASAIVMADEEATDGADPELKTLSQSIYTDQAAQIGQMQQLLAAGTT